ncbi:O-antigen ligase family protein [Comamonas endophytica]|uniref:O-antigen ligase family protein n=1 Tax=Comamonas endophytica TaxID=2949090 RepID=A0ABY6GDJ1_9BURK|nr:MULTISPECIES: O-antigen ligase family protein [unclassified Acidovorax]MCD2512558.1 O-antigen ligase family protein [Acidovorax sp. D4N7]UYG53079.1 O-antigen ligase family protein [Acidovorax sp. 5MLIR]
MPLALMTAAAFLLPAAALSLKSGYSYGIAIMVIAALCWVHRWALRRPDRGTLLLLVLFAAMACMWFELSALEDAARRWDRPVKFLLGAMCLLFAMAHPPRPAAFFWGLVVGTIGGGLTGLWQVHVLQLPRATGYTNAIQWGNIALLMATLLAVQAGVHWQQLRRWQKPVVVLAVALGLQASLLSASRGGWVALGLALPAVLVIVWRYRRELLWKLIAGFALALAVAGAANIGMLSQRMQLAQDEISHYFEESHTHSSLGIRLEQYRLAGQLVSEKPLLGWGMLGYIDEMHRRVDAGQYSQSIREYNFIHNEFIDLWVKLGVPGVLLQAALYVSVLALFWPSARRMRRFEGAPERWRNVLALRLAGSMVPLMYFSFGLTQHFFVHNSGIVFFVFCVVILWSALRGQEGHAGSAA